MESYQALKARLAQEEQRPDFDKKILRPLKEMVHWLEKSICNTQPKQAVVGQRKLAEGGFVTRAMFERKEKTAHVCPFVKDSLDANLFWFEESTATREDREVIEQRLVDMVEEFVKVAPAYDPIKEKRADGAPSPGVFKAFLLVVPNFRLLGSRKADSLMDNIHEKIKPEYVKRGLMLGQFYSTCQQAGVYNEAWLALTSPWPAFAARYMVRHDRLFVKGELLPFYEQYFPERKEEIAGQK
jgi:hypothetical protein